VIEDNTAVGNSNGILLVAGVQGETVRGNVALGNPPLQVAVDHTSGAGADIVNRATAGANNFQSNVCITSVNAPCPAVTAPSLTASPNPIPVTGTAFFGMTVLSWLAPAVETVEVHVNRPDGPLFAQGGSRGSSQTGIWVPDGMTFYLQDVSGGKPLTEANTLATVVVQLQRR
jgi:parallel beta-helix repeat protein